MNKPINLGGHAFPTMARGEVLTEDGYRQREWVESGMSLRDYFAAQALIGYMSNSQDDGCEPTNLYLAKTRDASGVAELCYVIADAMLKARQS